MATYTLVDDSFDVNVFTSAGAVEKYLLDLGVKEIRRHPWRADSVENTIKKIGQLKKFETAYALHPSMDDSDWLYKIQRQA